MSPTAHPNQDQLLTYARELADAYELLQAQNQLLPAPLRVGDTQAPTSRTITVLCLELAGINERLEKAHDDAHVLLGLINEHLTVAVSAIETHGGVVERFAATGLMATFGARDDRADASHLAVTAAMAAQGSNEYFNRQHGSAHWLDAGISIATGPAAMGRLGAPHRWEMGILGDCVNVAAGLAAKATPGEILMESTVYKAVDTAIRARAGGHTWIHRREGGVTVYSVKPVEP